MRSHPLIMGQLWTAAKLLTWHVGCCELNSPSTRGVANDPLPVLKQVFRSVRHRHDLAESVEGSWSLLKARGRRFPRLLEYTPE
jgi:hypothetical protein